MGECGHGGLLSGIGDEADPLRDGGVAAFDGARKMGGGGGGMDGFKYLPGAPDEDWPFSESADPVRSGDLAAALSGVDGADVGDAEDSGDVGGGVVGVQVALGGFGGCGLEYAECVGCDGEWVAGCALLARRKWVGETPARAKPASRRVGPALC